MSPSSTQDVKKALRANEGMLTLYGGLEWAFTSCKVQRDNVLLFDGHTTLFSHQMHLTE